MNEPNEKLYYGSFDSGDVKLHYSRTSLGYPPVVFLHGLTDSGAGWNRLAAKLYQSYDVFLPDARGHGYSEGPQSGYSLTSLTEDAANLIKTFQLNKPVVIGHSMGGAVTGNLAAEYPDLVRAIVLIDPPWYDFSQLSLEFSQKMTEDFEARYEEYQRLTGQEMFAYARKEHPNWTEEDLIPWAKSKQQFKKPVLEMIPSLAINWPTISEKIKCPALIMTADQKKGAIISPEILSELMNNQPNWESTYYEDSGHNIQRDQFELSKKAIAAFLKKVYRG